MSALETTLVMPDAMFFSDEKDRWVRVGRNEQITEALHPEFGWWYWEIDKVRNA
jgi:hypothetical protein